MDQNAIISLKWKRPVRILACPFVQIQRKYRLWQYQRSEDSLYIRELKDIYKGESCFVIGNGPSLTEGDLDKLYSSGTICFAANRIYKIFPKTEWRPTFYLCVDKHLLRTSFTEIRHIGDFPKFVEFTARAFGRNKEENLHYLYLYSCFRISQKKWVPKALSADVSKYSASCGTVTVNSIELAIYMGFSKIYLLGVDNSYANKIRPNGKIYADPDVKSSYFSGGEPDKSIGVSIQPVEIMVKSYEVAKKFAEEHGVKIFNATRGGKLEVFERVDFDSLFSDKG